MAYLISESALGNRRDLRWPGRGLAGRKPKANANSLNWPFQPDQPSHQISSNQSAFRLIPELENTTTTGRVFVDNF